LTLELNAAPNADNWALARQAGVPIICHIVGADPVISKQSAKPD
jgi:hypothetical protein